MSAPIAHPRGWSIFAWAMVGYSVSCVGEANGEVAITLWCVMALSFHGVGMTLYYESLRQASVRDLASAQDKRARSGVITMLIHKPGQWAFLCAAMTVVAILIASHAEETKQMVKATIAALGFIPLARTLDIEARRQADQRRASEAPDEPTRAEDAE